MGSDKSRRSQGAPMLLRIIFLFIFGISFSVASASTATNELTIYGIPTYKPIKWWAPKVLAWSGIMAGWKAQKAEVTHPIGHAMVEIRCAAFEGNPERLVYGAMTTQSGDNQERKLILEEKVGLGLLFTPLAGRLETGVDLIPEINNRSKNGQLRFLKIAVNPSNCQRLLRYYDEFVLRGNHLHYGYPSRPRHNQGASCTTYAYSFLDVAGVWNTELANAFTRDFRVPLSHVGGTIDGVATGRKVSIHEVLKLDSWANENEPHRMYTARDLTWFVNYIDKVFDGSYKSPTFFFSPAVSGKAKGLTLDIRHQATPSEPLFFK